MLELVGTPEDQFSRVAAHIKVGYTIHRRYPDGALLEPVMGFSNQVLHKLACTVTEEGENLEIPELERRSIVPSVKQK